MPENTVIAALQKAVEQAPDDVDLRLHLAEQLLAHAQHEAALAQCTFILERHPAHAGALRAAATAARAIGDNARADAYAKLAAALGADESAETPGAPVPVRSDGPPSLRVVGGSATTDTPAPAVDAAVTLDDVAGLADVKERLELAL